MIWLYKVQILNRFENVFWDIELKKWKYLFLYLKLSKIKREKHTEEKLATQIVSCLSLLGYYQFLLSESRRLNVEGFFIIA